MKYLAIVSGVFWLITLGAFLWMRLRRGADEPIAGIITALVAGALAVISTLVLGIVALVKWIGV